MIATPMFRKVSTCLGKPMLFAFNEDSLRRAVTWHICTGNVRLSPIFMREPTTKGSVSYSLVALADLVGQCSPTDSLRRTYKLANSGLEQKPIWTEFSLSEVRPGF